MQGAQEEITGPLLMSGATRGWERQRLRPRASRLHERLPVQD